MKKTMHPAPCAARQGLARRVHAGFLFALLIVCASAASAGNDPIDVERNNGTYRLVAALGQDGESLEANRDVVCFYRTDGDHFSILDCVLQPQPYVSRAGVEYERAYVLEIAVQAEPGFEVRARTIRGVTASPLSESYLRLLP